MWWISCPDLGGLNTTGAWVVAVDVAKLRVDFLSGGRSHMSWCRHNCTGQFYNYCNDYSWIALERGDDAAKFWAVWAPDSYDCELVMVDAETSTSCLPFIIRSIERER